MTTRKTHQFANELSTCLEFGNKTDEQKLKLILHVGTPKTGTTSLQKYLEKKQSKLRRKGILYPKNILNITNPSAPRHHWFEKNLLSTHVDFFLENFKNIVTQVDESTHTIVLSSEGIYSQWWSFPDESIELLRVLNELFQVEVWVWFREPCEFVESFYKQCIRNPRIVGNPCYGKDLSIAEMLDRGWFTKHLDYKGFVDDCENVFSEGTVKAYEYDVDIVRSISNIFNLATTHDNPTLRLNNSLSAPAVSLLRRINQLNIKPKDKERLMPHVRQMDEILSTYEVGSLIDQESRERILELANLVSCLEI